MFSVVATGGSKINAFRGLDWKLHKLLSSCLLHSVHLFFINMKS